MKDRAGVQQFLVFIFEIKLNITYKLTNTHIDIGHFVYFEYSSVVFFISSRLNKVLRSSIWMKYGRV